jgi:hypothetical protein
MGAANVPNASLDAGCEVLEMRAFEVTRVERPALEHPSAVLELACDDRLGERAAVLLVVRCSKLGEAEMDIATRWTTEHEPDPARARQCTHPDVSTGALGEHVTANLRMSK